MKQAIEKIMQFITTTVHPNNTVNLNLSETGLKSLLDTFLSEIEDIKRHLVASLFDLEKQSDVESLVQNYQSVIIKLLNDLYSYQLNHNNNKSLLSFYISINSSLSDILTYIEKYFSIHFNIDEKVPDIYYLIYSKDFEQQLSELNLQLKNKSVDQELISIINSAYSFTSNDSNKHTFTYRNIIYLKELISELTGVVLDKSLHKSARDVLLYLNFNKLEFFKYLVDNLQEEYNKVKTSEAKLELLQYQRKLFRQMHTKPNFALFFELPSIKEQVLYWIEEEINFVESQNKEAEQLPEKKETEQKTESKISVTLSVGQLGYLIRILTLGKVITNNNQSDIIRIFASNFRTYKTEEISYGSLYGKYFKPEPAAIREVKDVLLRLINLMNKLKD